MAEDKEEKTVTMKKMTMRRLRLQRLWVGLRPTWSWECVLVLSTLVVPATLACFWELDAVLSVTSFAFFVLALAFLDMKKEKEHMRQSRDYYKSLLEKENTQKDEQKQ